MKINIYILFTLILLSCKTEKKQSVDTITETVQSDIKVTQEAELTKSKPEYEIEKVIDTTWTHPDYFRFENYKEYKLNDTIQIDLNGNGIIEKIYFTQEGCKKLIIAEDGQKDISLGCRHEGYPNFPNAVGWVNLWCIVSDKKVSEVIVENGELMYDTIVNLERPSIYIGKEEAGGGIITYRNHELYWVHQSD